MARRPENKISKHFYVYVLLSQSDGNFYIGFTQDIHKRLEQHNRGENKSTAPRTPFKLIYFEYHLSREDALRRESYFKTSSGKRSLKQMIRDSLLVTSPQEIRRLIIRKFE